MCTHDLETLYYRSTKDLLQNLHFASIHIHTLEKTSKNLNKSN